MTISHPTLQQDCVQSAKLLLDYMLAHKDEGKGMFSVQVRSVQGTLLNTDLVLHLERRMHHAGGFTIRIGSTIYENKENDVKFLIQSVDKRQVVITPMPELAAHIDAAQKTKEKIFIEADLTFLVRRLKEWYERHGNEIRIPDAKPTCSLDPDCPINLSENQLDCVNKAMASPLSYIWGAPGTGKTKHVLAACVYSYIKAGKKVLLLAPTNTALEQSLSGLLQALSRNGGFNPDGKVLRLGLPSDKFKRNWTNQCMNGAYTYLKMEMDERISHLKYQNSMIETSMEIRAGKAETSAEDRYPEMDLAALEKKKKENTREINSLMQQSHKMAESKSVMPQISRFSVVAATVDTGRYWTPPGGDFKPDHVFLDEAGYCCVIKGLPLTAYNCPLTMLGDHMQLPPVFDCEDKQLTNSPDTRIIRLWEISTLYNEDVIFSNDRSRLCAYKMIQRPRFDHTTTGALTETYRFGPALANTLARIYYNRFCSKSKNETQILFVNAPKSANDKELTANRKKKRVSHTELKCIRELIEHNLTHYNYTIGIITPYKNQRNIIDRSIAGLMRKYKIEYDMDEDILTVHSSQGREWDVVLFSITDSYAEKWLTNSSRLESLKLINTAVSRAKKMLILVGDADDWKGRSGQLISDLFRVAKEADPEKIRFEDCLGGPDEEEDSKNK